MGPWFAYKRACAPLLTAAVLALTACASPAPLSGSRASPATGATQPRPPVPQPTVPAPTGAPPVVTAPMVVPPPPVPMPPGAPAEVAAPPPPSVVASPPAPALIPPTSDTITLVLPLDSPTYARAAGAVRAGFLAAAGAANSVAQTRVIAHGDDGVLPAFAAAVAAGSALVVGPLTRDDLKTVLAMALTRPRMLALNQLEDSAPLPGDVYALTLSVDNDAAQLARVAHDDGVVLIAIVVSDTPLQRRFAAAFAAAWKRDGGTPPREYRFDPNPDLLGALRRDLAGKPPDAILLAVDGTDAPLAKSFLPPLTVYASSQIADNLSLAMLRDLDNVRYVEIPWLADPGNPAFARVPHSNLGDPVLERLYALGLDAFAVAQMLAEPIPPQRIELDGATGHLTLVPSRSLVREGKIMVIRDGQPVVYPAPQ